MRVRAPGNAGAGGRNPGWRAGYRGRWRGSDAKCVEQIGAGHDEVHRGVHAARASGGRGGGGHTAGRHEGEYCDEKGPAPRRVPRDANMVRGQLMRHNKRVSSRVMAAMQLAGHASRTRQHRQAHHAVGVPNRNVERAVELLLGSISGHHGVETGVDGVKRTFCARALLAVACIKGGPPIHAAESNSEGRAIGDQEARRRRSSRALSW